MLSRRIYCCGCKKPVKADYLDNDSTWACPTCSASVVCHMGTINPIGYLQSKEMLNARGHLHDAIRELADLTGSSNSFIYAELSKALGVRQFSTAKIKTIEDARVIYCMLLRYKEVILNA